MEPEGIISITLEEETEESVDASDFLSDFVYRESLNTLRPLFVDRASLTLDTLRYLGLQEDVENPSGLPSNISEEETETRLVAGGDSSGTIQMPNTVSFNRFNGTEWSGNGPRRITGEEPQIVASSFESFLTDLSESLDTSLGIPVGYRLGIDSKKNTKQKKSTHVVTPTDNPNILNVDWGLDKYRLNEFTKQKKSLFNSDDINTIEKHAIISINNKEIVDLLESTDNSLMLLREHLPQNIKRDIDNNINVPSLLFAVAPKYVSQFTLEYLSEVDPKPHNWEYVKKNVYKRNYGTGDIGHHILKYFRTVTSDINESKSDRGLKNLLGILGFVKFSSYLSSVRNPEEFAEAAAQMGMNEDDILKKTRGFKELFILKLTEFDFRELWGINYFSKRPDGVIELDTKGMWSNKLHKHYQIKTVYL